MLLGMVLTGWEQDFRPEDSTYHVWLNEGMLLQQEL